ncbi:hypothetical protein [Rahnella woolbedingensis]|uniref:J domain-containing protein n=1 Tax=Rahnella woolbedingensis TaxID=1510574 RepID=A0A419N399_9GAMM|nr:hypothetical protein [Rahnella woolbedingensis]RJT37384.1 hypothetical protein D6C13_22225 [Rahnella woolbedingensis]
MPQNRLVKTKPTPKSNLSDPQHQFQERWKKIETLQLNISALEQQQRCLLLRFQQEILPIEHQYLQALYEKTVRLISFAGKKSLGKYDRDALFGWIEHEFDELYHHPFNENIDLEALNKQLLAINKAQDDELPTQGEIDRLRHLLNETYESAQELTDDDLAEMMMDPEKLRATMEQLFQNTPDDFINDDEMHGTENDNAADHSQSAWGGLLKSLEVNKMYKKIATLLHPDREQDPAKKEEKHQLMVQLSKAKKEHDIWTILGMYRLYVDSTFHFSHEAMPAINELLQSRIEVLNFELSQLKSPHSLTGMVWERFGGRTSKTIDNNFRKYSEQLREGIATETEIREDLRSLTVLKKYLGMRRDDWEWL